jgi:hypothetical protein
VGIFSRFLGSGFKRFTPPCEPGPTAPARIIRLGPEEAGNDLAGAGVKRTIRICGTLILSGLSADGAAQLALGLGLGADGATLAGIAAFFSNFMIALIAA